MRNKSRFLCPFLLPPQEDQFRQKFIPFQKGRRLIFFFSMGTEEGIRGKIWAEKQQSVIFSVTPTALPQAKLHARPMV